MPEHSSHKPHEPPEHNAYIGFQVRSLSNLLRRSLEAALGAGEELGGMQRFVLGYLFKRGDEPVFQRDIEESFRIRRSTVSVLLRALEGKGLLRRESVPDDARLKRLVLTEKALAQHAAIEAQIEELEERMRRGLSERELAALFSTLEKIRKNLEDTDT